jgi:hypothetical protein
MTHKLLVTLAVLALLLAACAPQPTQPPQEPPVVTEEPSSPASETEYPGPDTVQIVPTVPSIYPSPDAPVSSGGSGVGGGPVENSYAPQPGDDKLTRGPVFLELAQSELQVMESAPIQVTALLRGNLPDPCHQLRAIVTVDESQKRVDIELYSLTEPDVACITVIEPFEASLPLGSFSGGHYSVYVTTDPSLPAERLGEFDS